MMANKEYQKRGYVYVLSNPAMPGMLKVGKSTAGGRQRAGQLYTTGVPSPFVLEFEILVEDPGFVEAAAHEDLDRFRANGSREFFSCETDDAVRAVMNAAAFCMDHELVPFDLVWDPVSLDYLAARLKEDSGIDVHPIPLFYAIQKNMTPEIAKHLYEVYQDDVRRRMNERKMRQEGKDEEMTIQ